MTKPFLWEPKLRAKGALQRLAAGLCLLAISAGSLSAAELYKYINADGNLEVSSAVPSNLVSNGYTVVNAKGQILRVVAPQMNSEEIKQKAAQEKLDAKKLALVKWEDELMLRYSSPADVEYARDQKTQAIDALIASTALIIDRLKVKKQQLELQAANLERAGEVLSPKILRNLSVVEEQLQGRLAEIATRMTEQKKTREEFERIILKVRELYGMPNSAFSEGSVNMDLSRIDH